MLRLYDGLCGEQVLFDSLCFVYDLDTETGLPYIADISRSDSRVKAEKNGYERGVVNALKWIFAKCEPGPVIVVMGDNSDKLSIIGEMVNLWQSGADIVSPSRYMKGGKQHGGGLVKSSMSRVAGMSLKLFGFPTADPTNNFKLYDAEWLRAQQIESTGGFEIALELCFKAYAQGKRIVELPTGFDRTEGKSNFKLMRWLPKYLRWYLAALRCLLLGKFSVRMPHTL